MLSFFFPGDSHTKGFLVLLHPDLDPKEGLVTFKVTLSNDRFLCVYDPSGHSTRDQLVKGRFFEGLQTYMEKKREGNENKIILGDFNSAMDKMDRNSGNKNTGFIDVVRIMICQN